MKFESRVALDSQRNIVPITLEGFDFGDPTLSDKFQDEFKRLREYNALSVPFEYFEAAMERLRREYLNVPLESVHHPSSAALDDFVATSQAGANAEPKVGKEKVEAQQWFERGYAASKVDDQIAYYSEAIRLDPTLANAYNNRGITHSDLGDHAAAIGDYNEAIRIDPNDATAYINRGASHRDLGDHAAAIEDYNEAIRLDPNDANAYNNRGNSHRDLGGPRGCH